MVKPIELEKGGKSAMKQKFDPGYMVCTAGVNGRMLEDQNFRKHVHECLLRHLLGDWGDVCEEDRQANEMALVRNTRLFSAYKAKGLPKIWIITEADRSSTCILFPEEY